MGVGSAAKKANNEALDIQRKAAADAKAAQDQAIALKQKAIADNPYVTYLETPAAQEYQSTLKDRLAGKGLIDVNSQTSPIAAQIRAGEKQTNAAIGSAASARGLGRSSVATSQIGASSQAAERDIAERMANLELTRQQQIENAVTQYGDLSKTEAQSQANKVNYNVGNQNNVADSIAGYAQQAASNQNLIANTIRSSGAQQAAFQLQQLQMWLSTGATAATLGAGLITNGATRLASSSGNAAQVNTGAINGSMGMSGNLANRLGY